VHSTLSSGSTGAKVDQHGHRKTKGCVKKYLLDAFIQPASHWLSVQGVGEYHLTTQSDLIKGSHKTTKEGKIQTQRYILPPTLLRIKWTRPEVYTVFKDTALEADCLHLPTGCWHILMAKHLPSFLGTIYGQHHLLQDH
jgi:hypothetical protein